MDISTVIIQAAIPIVVGICVCIGYVLKNLVPTEKVNKYIPLVMAVLGVLLNTWINLSFTPDILFGGLASGLAATGCYELVSNLKSIDLKKIFTSDRDDT